jgi:mono/diheme cytochrome c family protein/plastocyanin
MKETLARLFAVLLLLGGSISIGLAWWLGGVDTITLHARMPEAGGWAPTDLTLAAGQPLHLRLTSDDVMHGFAIGQSDQPAVDIKPGEMTDITLSFAQPGTYTFYCTRWCGANHWRMRGTITVTGDAPEQTVTPPLYAQLGLDIDATHEARAVPEKQPSAQRGSALFDQLPITNLPTYQSPDYYRSHSPEQAWRDLRDNLELKSYSDQQLWDAVAYIWQANTTPEALAEARELYAQNCAACHGESGSGDGVFSGEQVQIQNEAGGMLSRHENVNPTDFTDPAQMLSAAPALLQGKLIRGGMGTGMPMWGVIFTEEQTWALVSYLYTFQFEEVP